jgi:hypothetical protein
MMKHMVWKSQHENDGLGKYGGRDLVGFGEKPPSPKWPNNAKVALNFVVNYEEGGENCILHGDSGSESLLSDIVGAVPYGKTKDSATGELEQGYQNRPTSARARPCL